MGDRSIHRGPCNGPRQSCPDHEHMDQIHLPGHPWEHGDLVSFHRCLCHRGSQTWILDGIRWCCSTAIRIARLLPHGPGAARNLSSSRLCVEVREADVSTSNIPSCARDPEIQYPGLQAENGAIPKSDPKGQTSAKNAEAEGLRFQPGG